MLAKSNKHRLGFSNQTHIQRTMEYDVICTKLLSVQPCDEIIHNCDDVAIINEPVVESDIDTLEQTQPSTELQVADKIKSIENVITVTKLRNKMLRKNSW